MPRIAPIDGAAQHRLVGLPEVVLVRQQAADGLAHHVAVLGMVEVAQDLGDAEDAHGQHREIDAVGQERQAEGHALLAGLEVGADRGEQHARPGSWRSP